MSQGPAAHLYVMNQTFSGSSSQQSPSVIEPKQVYCGKTRPVSLILFSSCFPSLALTSLSLHLAPPLSFVSLSHSFTASFLPLFLPPSSSPPLSPPAWTCWSAVSISVFPLGSDSAHPVSHPVYCHSIPLCSRRASGGRPLGLSA